MKIIVPILCVAILVLALQSYRDHLLITAQRAEVLAFKSQLGSLPRNGSLKLQEQCSNQARKEFNERGFASNDFAGYENHYNAALNKCFVLFRSTSTKFKPDIWHYSTLADAYEEKEYGDYSWHTVKGKKYWEVPPFSCKVTLPSGAEKTCNSEDEFNDLIKPYMND